MNRNHRFKWASVLLLVAGPALAQAPAQPVEVDRVKWVEYSQTSDVVGRFIARRQGDVAIRIDGAIMDIPVEIGDHVNAGDVMARIDPELLENEVETAQANLDLTSAALATRRAELGLARQEVNRLSRLRGSAAASEADYDDARQQQVVKQAQVEEAQVAIRQREIDLTVAKTRLGYASLRAPYNGIVTKRYSEIGDFVQRGEPMFTLTGDTDLEIEANVFAEFISGLEPGLGVAAVAANGEPYEFTATVRAILPVENDRTRTRVVRFSFDPDDGSHGFAPGQSVALRIPAGPRHDVLSVHKDAITYKAGAPVAFVVIDGKAQPRELKLGDVVGNRFEVLEGLDSGDLVVTRGNERMQPNQSVTYQEASG